MRDCEKCQECCIGLPIQTLNKKEGDPCVHIENGRCGIYENRYDLCRNFSCQWLLEDPLTKEEWRPDFCGFILWEGESFGNKVVCLKVTRVEANNSQECREAILRYGKARRGEFLVMKKKKGNL